MSKKQEIIQVSDSEWLVPLRSPSGEYTKVFRGSDGEYWFYSLQPAKFTTPSFEKALELARTGGASFGTLEDVLAKTPIPVEVKRPRLKICS